MRESPAESTAGSAVRRTARPVWVVVAVLLVTGGIVGAMFGARSVARSDAEKARRGFEQTSDQVASTLQLAIQHQEDLVVSLAAFFLREPDVTNEGFREWSESIRAMERYPELEGVALIVIVAPSELDEFVARVDADPSVPLGPDQPFEIIPPGDRPYYCFSPVGQGRTPDAELPIGFDLCETGIAPALTSSRDSGTAAYAPIQLGETTWLGVSTPMYRGGAIPSSVEERRASFVGHVGMTVEPQVVLDRALQGHPDTAVSMRYRQTASDVTFSSGTVPPGAASRVSDLHNGWTVQTFGPAVSGAVFDNPAALALLVSGLAVSVLLGVLVMVLATSRDRALRLVGVKTGELRHQALHDALTGLPNRALIMDRIEQLLVRSRRNGTQSAALFIDLDEFKNVNDTLGHEAGDRLLVAVATRLEGALRDADTIGRMGGDEFVVLVDGASVDVAPELVAERLLDVMRQPFELEGVATPVFVSTSIGLAVGDRASGGDLLRDADVALYQAKAAGKNRYEVFYPEMQTEVAHRIELEFDLRSALDGDQYRLVYQPIYNLDDLSLVGVEALLRWQHPTNGVVLPDDFVPILEQTGQIREVGRWVLRHACTQMARWHALGDTLDVSVNVSGRQLDNDDIIEHVREALDSSGLDAGSLIIEVTETALMRNAEATARRLRAIRELGVRVAVDDFGTGYSSLAYLQQFPVDCLKIDRRFTNAITTSPESRSLIGMLVQLGRDLGLKTLAEGVETTDEVDHLRGEHVDEAQGFLLARPLAADELEVQLLQPTRDAAPSEPQS
jgi:diguanylate cyclase (GGDEF)-like protein